LQQYETIIYLYSQGKVCYEKNVTTDMDALYIYGPGGKIAKKIGENIVDYHTDHLGSTRLQTDAAGNPVTAVEYYPFGIIDQFTGEDERYLFTGQEKDLTGLYYYKARYYDPEIGRFLTRDKWSGDRKRPQTMNGYVYCLNNPLKYEDPSGNAPSDYFDEYHDLIASLEGDGDGSGEPPVGTLSESVFYSEDPIEMLAFWLGYSMVPAFENEEAEKFREFFNHGCNIGCMHYDGKEYDAVFEDANKKVDNLLREVREATAACLATAGFSIPMTGGPITTALNAVKTAYEVYVPAKIAYEHAPKTEKEAGGGFELVIIGMLILVLMRKRKGGIA